MKTTPQTSGRSPRQPLPAAIRLHDLIWWRWTAIAVLLAADLAGLPAARECALVIAIYQLLNGLKDDPTPGYFRTQVGIVYVLMMGISFIPVMCFISWIQMVGTFAVVLFGYCPLARTMVLLPGNRPTRMSWALIRHVASHPATTGSILEALKAPHGNGSNPRGSEPLFPT